MGRRAVRPSAANRAALPAVLQVLRHKADNRKAIEATTPTPTTAAVAVTTQMVAAGAGTIEAVVANARSAAAAWASADRAAQAAVFSQAARVAEAAMAHRVVGAVGEAGDTRA